MFDEQKPEVIYIAGYGRSGSTLLDCLLARKPGNFGGGELTNLFDEMYRDRTCSCGVSLSACELWSEILTEIEPDRTEPALAKEARRAERLFLPSVHEKYLGAWKRIILALSERRQIRFLIDSSKTSRLAFRRPLLLRKIGCKVYLIHLIRRPEGVVHSLRKGSNKALEAGRSATIGGYWIRGVFGWFVANMLVERLVGRHHFERLIVRYEDLVQQPEVELARIADMTGAENLRGPDIEEFVDHGISGNRMRRQGRSHAIDAAVDVDEDFSTLQRVAVVLMDRWGKKRGYWAV